MIYLVCQVNSFNFENAVIWREVLNRESTGFGKDSVTINIGSRAHRNTQVWKLNLGLML